MDSRNFLIVVTMESVTNFKKISQATVKQNPMNTCLPLNVSPVVTLHAGRQLFNQYNFYYILWSEIICITSFNSMVKFSKQSNPASCLETHVWNFYEMNTRMHPAGTSVNSAICENCSKFCLCIIM